MCASDAQEGEEAAPPGVPKLVFVDPQKLASMKFNLSQSVKDQAVQEAVKREAAAKAGAEGAGQETAAAQSPNPVDEYTSKLCKPTTGLSFCTGRWSAVGGLLSVCGVGWLRCCGGWTG